MKFEAVKYILKAIIAPLIIMLVCIGLLIYTTKAEKASSKEVVDHVKIFGGRMLENGYAQGQLDAARGIIRIRMINDSTCVWSSSPWGKNTKTFCDTIKNLNIVGENGSK